MPDKPSHQFCFADVLLPLPLKGTFTYLLDKTLSDDWVGRRVIVPFGKNKFYTGIIAAVHQQNPAHYEAKPIESIIDESPMVFANQIAYWRWVANYYMCPLGLVFKKAIPSLLLLSSETKVLLTEEAHLKKDTLTDDEYLVFEALQTAVELDIKTVQKILGRNRVFPLIESLIKAEVVILKEVLLDKYRPKQITCLKLHDDYKNQEALADLMDQLQNAPKQRQALIHYFQFKAGKGENTLILDDFLKQTGINRPIIKTLEKKGCFEIYQLEQRRIERKDAVARHFGQLVLSEKQTDLAKQIQAGFQQKGITLLKNSGGQDFVPLCISLMQQVVGQGEKQVLILVPDLGFSQAMIREVSAYFVGKVSLFNANTSLPVRLELWRALCARDPLTQIVIGTANSVLLPFQDLGLVVVVNESDQAYYQGQRMPRYHARDAALVLAKKHGASALLTAVSPSLESYFNAQRGRYHLVTIQQAQEQYPKVALIDLKKAYFKKEMRGIFSDILFLAIEEVLQQGNQVVLFQHKRGYAPVMTCKTCGHTPYCVNCDVSLTYHKNAQRLKCHYCNYQTAVTPRCKACQSKDLATTGLGTEQVVQALLGLFPKANIDRLDSDTIKGKNSYRQIMERFDTGKTDILVGNRLITKGLNLEKVALIGVVSVDAFLAVPDFRAHENTYHLLQQLASRVLATNQICKMMIQTFDPHHRILQQLSTYHYQSMFKEQLQLRHDFKYPPYHRIIKMTFKHRNTTVLKEAMAWLGAVLKQTFSEQLLGPAIPHVPRINNQYLQYFILKINSDQSPQKVKAYLNKVFDAFESMPNFRGVQVQIAVDC